MSEFMFALGLTAVIIGLWVAACLWAGRGGGM